MTQQGKYAIIMALYKKKDRKECGNDGFLPDIILLTRCYLHRGTCFKCHEEVLYLQPLIPPKHFDIFSPITGGCSEGLGAF